MKKLLLSLSAWFFAALSVCAQTAPADTTASTLKPKRRNVATELNINPFNGTLSLNNSLNQLKFRFFASTALAWRLGLTGNRISNFSENTNPYGNNPYNYKNERSSTTLGLNLGLEKHFAGTKRLSPYVGADLAIANKSSKQEITEKQTVTTITGAWREYIYNGSNPNYPILSQEAERAYFRYGLNLVTGFDFYMAHHFFFGYEVNFGFSQTAYKEIEVSLSTFGGGSPSDNNDVKNTSFTFGPNLLNGVRIGYIF